MFDVAREPTRAKFSPPGDQAISLGMTQPPPEHVVRSRTAARRRHQMNRCGSADGEGDRDTVVGLPMQRQYADAEDYIEAHESSPHDDVAPGGIRGCSHRRL